VGPHLLYSQRFFAIFHPIFLFHLASEITGLRDTLRLGDSILASNYIDSDISERFDKAWA
jgi:hypothetical protein